MPNAKYFKYDEEYNLRPIYDDSVVEVVRCRDCKYRKELVGAWFYCEKNYDQTGWHKKVADNFFCAAGERK